MTGAATPGLPGSPSTPFLDGLFAAVRLDDAQLAPFFDGLDLAKLKAHQQAFIAAAIGGPEAYEGREMPKRTTAWASGITTSIGWSATSSPPLPA